MQALSKLLVASFLVSTLLAGCDANLKKELILRGGDRGEAAFQRNVQMTFESFAQRHGFSCRAGEVSPVVKTCRAVGPRFLELHRSGSSLTVYLDQPYPGGLMSKVPHDYVATSEELESEFRREFGDAVAVVAK